MLQISWNPDIVPRTVRGRHLLVDSHSPDKFLEISPVLADLFSDMHDTPFPLAYSTWSENNQFFCSDINSKVESVFLNLVQLGYLLSVPDED